jgi:hypothetical protein
MLVFRTLLVGPVLTLFTAGQGCVQSPSAGQPNIVLIVADGLSDGDLACCGGTRAPSPRRVPQMAAGVVRPCPSAAGSSSSAGAGSRSAAVNLRDSFCASSMTGAGSASNTRPSRVRTRAM